MLLALHASGNMGLYLYAILLGSSFGVSFSAMMVLPANYYGVKAYPSVVSTVMAVGTVAGAAGASLAGVVFDHFGSYTPAFYFVAGMSLLAAILLVLMRPARKRSAAIAPAGAAAV